MLMVVNILQRIGILALSNAVISVTLYLLCPIDTAPESRTQ
jgi:hypothetical protein